MYIETQVKFEFGRNRIMGSGLSAPEFVKITHFRGCWRSIIRTNIYWSLWNFGKRKIIYKYWSSSNMGINLLVGRLSYLPLNLSKLAILGVVDTLMKKYLMECMKLWQQVIHKHRSSSNLGEICSREVDYLPLNLSKLPILRVVGAITLTKFNDRYETLELVWLHRNTGQVRIWHKSVYWEIDYLPLNLSKLFILGVVDTLTWTNIYWLLWHFGNRKVT